MTLSSPHVGDGAKTFDAYGAVTNRLIRRGFIYTKQVNQNRRKDVPDFFVKVIDMAFVFIVLMALWEAISYVAESVRIFIRALKRYGTRNKE